MKSVSAPLDGLLVLQVVSSLPHPSPAFNALVPSEQQRKVHRGRLRLARKQGQQVARTAPISTEFRCAIYLRICRARIGLLIHHRTPA